MPPNSDRKVTSPKGDCPSKECAITVLVREHGGTKKGVSGLTVEVIGPGKVVIDKKKTDGEGLAEFKGLKKVNVSYSVQITLADKDKEVYDWYTSDKQYKKVAGGVDKFFLFELEKLARPKFKVVREDDQTIVIPSVGVMLSNRTDFGLSKVGTGIAELAKGTAGTAAGRYKIQLKISEKLSKDYQNIFEPNQIELDEGDIRTIILKVKPRPVLKIVELHDHFASGHEDWGFNYTIKNLAGKKVTLKVTSDHYTDGVIYEKELEGAELANGEGKEILWKGKTTCQNGDLKDRFIYPLYSPYKVTLEAETEKVTDQKLTKVVYGKIELTRGKWLAEETTPTEGTNDWIRFKLNDLGYYGGPFTNDANETAAQRLWREKATKLYKCMDGKYVGKAFADETWATQVSANSNSTAFYDFLDTDKDQFEAGLFVKRLKANKNRRTYFEGGDKGFPATGQQSKLYVPLLYYSKSDEFGPDDGLMDVEGRRLNDPFITIKAKIYLKTHDDKDVHCPKGVGKAKVGWRVEDPAEQGMNARYQTALSTQDTHRLPYMQAVQAHIAASGETYTDDATAFAKNCPPTCSGKSDLAKVFLSWKPFELAVSNKIPCSVASIDDQKEKTYGFTGVNFVTSRFAGDSFKVVADLDFSGLPNEADLKKYHGSNAQGRDASKVTSGTVTIWRDAKIIRVVQWPGEPLANYQMARIQQNFDHCYVKMAVPQAADVVTINQVITQDEYREVISEWSPGGLKPNLKAWLKADIKADLIASGSTDAEAETKAEAQAEAQSESQSKRITKDATPGSTFLFWRKFNLRNDALYGRDLPPQKRMKGRHYKVAMQSLMYGDDGFVSKMSEPLAALMSKKLRATHPWGHIIMSFLPHRPVTVYKAPGLLRRGAVEVADWTAKYCSMGLPDGVVSYDLGDHDSRGYVLTHEFGHHYMLYHHEKADDCWPDQHDRNDHNCLMSYGYYPPGPKPPLKASDGNYYYYKRPPDPPDLIATKYVPADPESPYNPLFCGKCNLRLRGWRVRYPHATFPQWSLPHGPIPPAP